MLSQPDAAKLLVRCGAMLDVLPLRCGQGWDSSRCICGCSYLRLLGIGLEALAAAAAALAMAAQSMSHRDGCIVARVTAVAVHAESA
jgi:hypothetical protein